MEPGTRLYQPPLTISREEFIAEESDANFREAIYTMVLSVERLLKCRSAFGRALGLTSSQFAVLMGVASRQKASGITIKALAEHVSLASPHVTTEIGRLESKGLLRKRENEIDRRSVLVSLTPKGEAEISRVTPFVREVNDILFRGIDLKGLTQAQRVARSIVTNSEDALSLVRKRRAAGSATDTTTPAVASPARGRGKVKSPARE